MGIRNLKISGAVNFRPTMKVSWMDLYCEFHDGPQGLEMCPLHLVVIPMYTDGFEPPVTDC